MGDDTKTLSIYSDSALKNTGAGYICVKFVTKRKKKQFFRTLDKIFMTKRKTKPLFFVFLFVFRENFFSLLTKTPPCSRPLGLELRRRLGVRVGVLVR